MTSEKLKLHLAAIALVAAAIGTAGGQIPGQVSVPVQQPVPQVVQSQVVPPAQPQGTQPMQNSVQSQIPMQMPGQAPMPNSQMSPPTQEPSSKRYADRPAVTIREFRSSVQEVPPRAATDMFITALIQTRKFRVVERARMNEGIAQEKLLNQQGTTTGQSGDTKYVGAKYMFEGTVSEAQMDQNTTSMGLNIMGLGGKKSYSSDSIGIDVRVIEVESGIVADAIKIRKPIKGEATEVGGIGDAITNVVSQRFLGGAVQASGNKEYESKRKDSIDEVMRLCIEEAVQQIAQRFSDE